MVIRMFVMTALVARPRLFLLLTASVVATACSRPAAAPAAATVPPVAVVAPPLPALTAQQWREKAEAIYREHLQQLPEASYGHAIQHYLQYGDPAEALALAHRNVELRPYGEARIALAQALFRAGQAGAAAREIDAVLTSGWNTAEMHAIAAQIHAALGHAAIADREREAALAMNPKAFRMYRLMPPALPDSVS